MIQWTPDSRALVLPLRDHPDFPPPALPSEREAWKELSLKRRSISAWQRRPLEQSMGDAAARFSGSPTGEDEAADALILLQTIAHLYDMHTHWTRWMIAAFGIGYALRVLARLLPADPAAVTPDEHARLQRLQALCPPLRAALARASAADHAAALARTEGMWEGHLSGLLLELFPDAPRDHRELAAPWLAAGQPLPEAFLAASRDDRLDAILAQGGWYSPAALATMLARRGEGGVALLCAISQSFIKDIAYSTDQIKILALCSGPPVARAMVGLLSAASPPTALVRGWVQREPAEGLAALAASGADSARLLHAELSRTVGVPEATGAALPQMLRPAALPALPPWARPDDLPAVLLRQQAPALLGAAGRAVVIAQACSGSLPAAKYLDPATLSGFLLGLLPMWRQAASKDKKLLHCIGASVDERHARIYLKQVEGWASSSGGFHNALAGMQGLAARGDSGLRLIHRLSLKAGSQGLRKRASGVLEAEAAARRLSRVELEDRLVPDLDLEPDGTCLLDFGPRRFRVGFDENLRPVISGVEADGSLKRLKDLPKPAKTDDAELAAAAVARWKDLKKEVRELASLQLKRLEHIFAEDRRWTVDAFTDCFVRHPLIQHLARRLLWGAWIGGAIHPFRVAEDGSFSDIDDQPWGLPPEGAAQARIGLLHPLLMSAGAVARWSTVFADYGLIQPFPQLARPVALLSDEEQAAPDLPRFIGRKTPGGRLLGLTSKPGWQKGHAVDNGFMESVSCLLPGGRTLDVLFAPGVSITGGYGTDEAQEIRSVRLRGGAVFTGLSAVQISELLLTLEALFA